MKKKSDLQFLFFLFFFIVFNSCQTHQRYLHNSIGKPDEVLVVMDDNNWKGELGDTFRKKFAVTFNVLPQAEPIFSIRQKNKMQFNELMQKYRNVIIVASLDEKNDVADFMREILGKDNIEKIQQGSSTFYLTKNEVWAEPQLVILIFSKTKNDLIDQLNRSAEKLIEVIHQSENRIISKKLFAYGRNDSTEQKIKLKFQLDFPLPLDYQVAMDNGSFLWLRKETIDLSSSIIVFFPDLNPVPENKGTPVEHIMRLQNGWKLRDEVGKNFISSNIEGSFMRTDTFIPVVQKSFLLNSYSVIETKGLWRMDKEFMGGPFINYVINDSKSKRIIIVDGFVYAPKLKKRQYIRELEVLFSAIR